jgi:hypothetical protein
MPGIKKILIGSGLRYDLAVKSPEYVKELVSTTWAATSRSPRAHRGR